MSKKVYTIFAALMIVTMLLSACTPKADEKPDCSKAETFCVGFVSDVGKIDDKSFNQSTWEGLKQAEAELGAKVQYIETTDAKDYAKNIATFADEKYDVIVTVGFALGEATVAAAKMYPDVKFIGVDQDQFAETVPNVAGLIFPEDNAGFLVGALAAQMTKTGKIGAVLGTDLVPPVWRFGEGYRAGAAYADAQKGTTTEVNVVYHNDVGFDKTFVDPEWGAQTADAMINNGADVIFGAGGKTGNGAVTEAAQKGVYAIGVDTDQYYTLPEAAPMLLSSAMKLITPGVAELIKIAKDAQGGAAFPAGNFMGKASYAPYHDLDSKVPADVKAFMEKLNTDIINGTVLTNVPPAKP
jgi:basic membrane protein A